MLVNTRVPRKFEAKGLLHPMFDSSKTGGFPKNENARKRSVYRHSVAEMVGFEPTDPGRDQRISSNETESNLPIFTVILSRIKITECQ